MTASGAIDYNFAYLDAEAERMFLSTLPGTYAPSGYQVPFVNRETPMSYGWGWGRSVRIPGYPVGCPDDIRSAVPGYPVTFEVRPLSVWF
ncbi:MAG: alpha-D-ribose 1-methylphosphonate 5-phosphate C-P-lyase PhnJ [Pseudomonadota bacterium]